MLEKGFVAATTVRPSRFVIMSNTHDSKVDEANDTDTRLLGISAEWRQDAPIPSETTGDAAASGEQLRVYGMGEICLLDLGSGGAQVGDYMKPDNDGKGVTGTLGTDFCGALAFETGAENDKIRVQVQFHNGAT